MESFLFAHFTSEHKNGEQIYFSVSEDGRHFTDLNDGLPALVSELGEKGARDPFLIRDEEQGKIYLIATDLQIAQGKGWEVAREQGSLNIVVWESTDLTDWSDPWLLPIPLENAGNVWAPEAIYDHEKGEFLLFWASNTSGKHKIYAAYTQDFKTVSTPFKFLEKDNDVIDTTIIEREGTYYRLSKDETTKRIIIEKSASLTGTYTAVESPTLELIKGVEGPEVYKVGENQWHLIVDRFAEGTGYAMLATADLGKTDFELLAEDEYDFGKKLKRHGGVLAITQTERQRLQSYYG